jgi:hypothetical protein
MWFYSEQFPGVWGGRWVAGLPDRYCMLSADFADYHSYNFMNSESHGEDDVSKNHVLLDPIGRLQDSTGSRE